VGKESRRCGQVSNAASKPCDIRHSVDLAITPSQEITKISSQAENDEKHWVDDGEFSTIHKPFFNG
jgi:hypothetical protein